jgi:hypothetical protein
LGVAALPLIGWPAGCAAAAAVGVLAHAVVRRPRPAPALLIYGDGQVDWPAAGFAGLEIADGTRFTALWALLVLRPPGGAPAFRVLLIADQLDTATWRTLLARLGRAGAIGRPPRADHDRRRDLR